MEKGKSPQINLIIRFYHLFHSAVINYPYSIMSKLMLSYHPKFYIQENPTKVLL